MTHLRSVAVATLAAGLMTIAVPAASADEWRASDHRHDVVRYHHDPDPEPCGTTTVQHLRKDRRTDITGLAVTHTSTEVVVTVRFRDLRGERPLFTEIPVRTNGKTYTVDVDRWKVGAHTTVALSPWRAPKHVGPCGAYGEVSTTKPCDGLAGTMSTSHDRVVAHVPRTCIGTPRWVRVGASVNRPHRGGTRYDNWQGAGARSVDYLGWLGPRVRHD